MTAAETTDWIKKIDAALLHLDEKPQFALPTEPPLSALEGLLEKLFDHPKIRIEHQARGWQKSLQLFDGLGENLSVLAIEWTPLEAPLYFILSEQDLKEMMADLLGGEEAATPFFDPALAEGFFHYLAIEVLQKLEAMRFLAPLSPRIGIAPLNIREELKEKNCFVSDVSLSLHEKNIWGRLLIPETFRKQLKSQMANLPHLEMSDTQAEKISVDVALEVGSGQLSVDEWKGVQNGDFIILDRCSFNPQEGKGSVTLKLGDEPIFRGRFKSGGIKISDYPLYEEVDNSMEEEPQVDGPEFFREEDADAHEGGFVSAPKQEIGTLPVNLTVEVGRVRMTIKELKQLAPGNLLELGVSPEQGVDLLVNGKKMGRGELISMGETLGIRILSF